MSLKVGWCVSPQLGAAPKHGADGVEDQPRAVQRRELAGAVVLRRDLDEVHADHVAARADRQQDRLGLVVAEAAGLGRAGARRDARVEGVDVEGDVRVDARLEVLDELVHERVLRLLAPEDLHLSLIHISEPTRLGMISYAVFCLKKKKK